MVAGGPVRPWHKLTELPVRAAGDGSVVLDDGWREQMSKQADARASNKRQRGQPRRKSSAGTAIDNSVAKEGFDLADKLKQLDERKRDLTSGIKKPVLYSFVVDQTLFYVS